MRPVLFRHRFSSDKATTSVSSGKCSTTSVKSIVSNSSDLNGRWKTVATISGLTRLLRSTFISAILVDLDPTESMKPPALRAS